MKDLLQCVAAVYRHRDVQELLIHSNQQEAGEGKKQLTCASQRRLHWLGLHLPSLLASLVLMESLASVEVLPQAQYCSVLNKCIFLFAPSDTWTPAVVLELEI